MESKFSAIVSKTEILLLILTVLISSLVSLLDLFGLLDGIPWLSERIPTMLTLGLLAGYILLERRTELQEISQKIHSLSENTQTSAQHIIQSLNGVEVQSFQDMQSCLQYVNRKLRTAKLQVDDLSWTPLHSWRGDLQPVVAENLQYEERVKSIAGKIPYREVFIFNKPHRENQLFQRLKENVPGYSCAYYPDIVSAPLLQFMIVDQEEVIVLTGSYSYISFNHPTLVQLFVEYYEDIWRSAVKLKYGKNIYWDEVEKIIGREKKVALQRDAA
jgi:hypothetical protein